MTVSAKLRNIEVYHPENQVGNDHFIKHFEEQGKDIRPLLKHMGKEQRYQINNDKENGVTMAIEASRKVMESSGLSMSDIDLIIFSTQLPQYTVPTNAVMVHRALQGDERTRVLDLNGSCAGMVVAIEQATAYIKSNPRIKRVLVVGSEHLTSFTSPTDEMPYSVFGDAACAMIMEATDEAVGYIDSDYHTDTPFAENLIYPELGFSESQKGRGEGQFLTYIPFDMGFAGPKADKMIAKVLERNELTLSDISAFSWSQMSKGDSIRFQEVNGVEWNQMLYIGDKYGYTGTTSPLLALHQGIQDGRVKRGDLVMFWTVGVGHQFVALLFKY